MIIEKYFREHSLKEEAVKKFGWTWNENVITIPIYDSDGNLLYYRYRHLNYEEEKARGNPKASKFSTDPGSHPALYAANLIKEKNTVVLCEGEPDCVRLWQEDIPAVTGTSGVNTFSKEIALPLAGKNICIALDNDKAGIEKVERYHKILLEIGAFPLIIEIPKKYKDVSEYMSDNHTKNDFLNLIKNAVNIDTWKENNEPEEFNWETTDEILNEDLPEEKWLIDKVISSSGFSFLVGPEATAKSIHAMLIARSLITGQPYLDKFKVVKQVNVLFIDKENGKKRRQDRLRGLGFPEIKSDYKIHYQKYAQLVEIADRTGKSKDGYSETIKSISRKVQKYNIGLIIIDSFTDILEGDENDRAAIQNFVSALKQLFPDIAYLVLHHASKYQPGGRKPVSQMARGSTNIMAQAYTAFHTEPVKNSKTEFTIEQTKAGDSIKLSKFLVELEITIDPLNQEETLVTNILYKGEIEDKTEKLEEAMQIIGDQFAEVVNMPLKELKAMLVDSGVIKDVTFRRAIDKLEDDGKIEKRKSITIRNGKDIVWKEG